MIASGLGAMAEIVEDGRTGLHFTPGDPEDLAAKVEWAWTHPKEMEAMGRAARAEYQAKYTAERNYHGGWERQKLFAQEVRRVAASGYFVTTPNRFFPIEPHTLMPFYQFFPVSVQRRLVRFSPGYLTRYEEINLLSAKDLRCLFPEAEVKGIGVPLYPNTLVAAFKADSP